MTWYVLPIAAVAVERMAELVVSFADRASVDIVQAGHPVRRFGHHPGQPATGLCHHLLGADPGPGVSRVL